jgi:formylmethanofuran dehydrogenase subunit C
LQMKGGTIFLMSGAEIRTGAWMVRGTIVSFTQIRLLPTFSYACAYNPVFLNLYVKHLDAMGCSLPSAGKSGTFHRHIGDASVPGKGELLVWQPDA